ncbi:ribonuclease-3 [Elusimicrobium posterum]|uniref:ribonuclease III n=1 Tax=Elusimicrobium posterum TaxID=3116653 RepID=UPI003C7670B4
MFSKVEQLIKYNFKSKELIKEALTHKSYSGERRSVKHNERLEFLGDSVLGVLVADYLYNRYQDVEEGVLSKIKSSLVSRHNLFLWAVELELGNFLILGSGEAATGGRTRESILSNTMEAVIGAMYLDGGLEAVRALVFPWIETQSLTPDSGDYKSTLQEYLQKLGKPAPTYEVIQTVGPEHDKIFTVTVICAKKEIATGKGRNKKLAEQDAAKNALATFKK